MLETLSVLTLNDMQGDYLIRILQKYGLALVTCSSGDDIPGSFWGDTEAGLIDNQIYATPDTPVHSILHETCHYICMDEQRRTGLHTNAGGDYDEENGVCYLQILLANEIPEMGSLRMMQDMDTWGYTFRLGSAQRWFEDDADDARNWLTSHNIIDAANIPTHKLRH